MTRLGRRLLSAALLVLAAALAAVALTLAPDRPVEDLAARWAPPPSQFVDIDGMRVHLRDVGPRGDAHPLVLLHGTSASLHTWEGWVSALSAQRRVITLDLPGFALTGPFPDGDYRVERYVAFMRALLDRLSIDHAVLIGNSFGGQVAWTTALALPERIDALVLVDAAGYPRAAKSVPIGFRVAQTPGLRLLMRQVLPRAFIESSLRNVYGDPSSVSDALVDRYWELTLRTGNRAALAARFEQSAPSPEWVAQIATLTLPTLILWGGRDRLIPPPLGERFERDIAGSRRVVFEELGHVPQEEDPMRSVAPVDGFLRDHRL